MWGTLVLQIVLTSHLLLLLSGRLTCRRFHYVIGHMFFLSYCQCHSWLYNPVHICLHVYVITFLWPPCVADADIIFLPCDFYLSSSSSYFFFFVAWSQRSSIGCLPYFHTWCGLSANLECMSELCCTRLAVKYRTQKNRHLGTIVQLCRAESSQLRHISTIGKKLVKQQFQRLSRLGSVTARHSSSGRWRNCGVKLNRGRHLYLAGRPSRWALAHISSFY